jgi:hypothetical protein
MDAGAGRRSLSSLLPALAIPGRPGCTLVFFRSKVFTFGLPDQCRTVCRPRRRCFTACSYCKRSALASAELHVIEARGRRSDQLEKIARLKAQGKDTLEVEQDLGLSIALPPN